MTAQPIITRRIAGFTTLGVLLTEIDIEHWGDGSWRFTIDGKEYKLRGGTTMSRLLETIMNTDGLVGTE